MHGSSPKKATRLARAEKRITVELLVDEVGRAFTEIGKC